MKKTLFIVETDPVPEDIKNQLLPYKVQYGYLLNSTDCEFVTEYKKSTTNFVDFVISFFEQNNNTFDVYQMRIARRGKTYVVDMESAASRVMASIIVRKNVFSLLGKNKYETFTSQYVFYPTEMQMKYLIKELSLSKMKADQELSYVYESKIEELSGFIDWKPSEKHFNSPGKSKEVLESIGLDERISSTRIEEGNTWKLIFKQIAIKLYLVKIYRKLKRELKRK